MWTLVAAVGMMPVATLSALSGRDPVSTRVVIIAFTVSWYVWWLATPALSRLTARFPLARAHWQRSALVHIAVALPLATVPGLVNMVVGNALGMPVSSRGLAASILQVLIFRYPIDLAVYAAVCAIATSVQLARRANEQQLATSRLGAELAEAKLQSLSSQLRPHFLFNSLNGVAMLIRDGRYDSALDMLLGYGDVLRASLDGHDALVPLEHELGIVAKYVAIEQMRFPDWFSLDLQVSPAIARAEVPSLILQPIIENALRHGLAQAETGGRIVVTACGEDDKLTLTVRDNGQGLPTPRPPANGTGIGLRNTAARLRHHYADAHRLRIQPASDGGTLVEIEIPLRFAVHPRRR